MESPAARLLTLLSLLQARPSWTATELSERMGVTGRTVRRDITQLRELGYPVDAEPGPHGGYRLGAGAALPPLLLTDDEAVAVVVGLRVATGHNVAGFEEAAVAALAKLEQVMPSHLRHRVDAVRTSTLPVSGRSGPPVDATTIVLVAQACRGLERLRFDYVDSGGDATDRLVEPFRLVHVDRRWYLVAYDPARRDWRTFRLDRMSGTRLTGARFVRDDEPDAATMVTEGLALHAHDEQAVVELDVPIDEALDEVPVSIGVLEATPTGCRLRIGGDIDWMARFLVNLPFGFRVIEPPELRSELRALGERLQRDHR
ncbi:MAG: helix-turn-helix transcriptional regulator [Acidimicrobiales bacterium]